MMELATISTYIQNAWKYVKCSVTEIVDVVIIDNNKPVSCYWKYLLIKNLCIAESITEYLHAKTNIDTFKYWQFMIEDIRIHSEFSLPLTMKIIRETYKNGVSKEIIKNSLLIDIVDNTHAVTDQDTDTDIVILKINIAEQSIKHLIMDYSDTTTIEDILLFENISYDATDPMIDIIGFHNRQKFTLTEPLTPNLNLKTLIENCKKMKN